MTGNQSTAGRCSRRHGVPVPRRRRRRSYCGRGSAATRCSPTLGADQARDRDARPAATWKARRCASASPTPRCSPRSRPTPRAARSTPCTTRFTPLGGLVPLLNIMLGEVIFGGVGAGLYGMLVFVILSVFIAGLMVGRTPEYLGKKIEAHEVKMAMLAVLDLPRSRSWCFAGLAARRAGFGTSRIVEPGPARPLRDPLRLHLGDRQQRHRLRRPDRQHRPGTTSTLGHRDAGRPLLHDHPDAGHRRQPGRQEDACRPRPGTFPVHDAALRRRCSSA